MASTNDGRTSHNAGTGAGMVYLHSGLTPSTLATIRAAYARKLELLSRVGECAVPIIQVEIGEGEDNWLDRERATTRLADEIEEALTNASTFAQSAEQEERAGTRQGGSENQASPDSRQTEQTFRDIGVDSLIEKAKRMRMEQGQTQYQEGPKAKRQKEEGVKKTMRGIGVKSSERDDFGANRAIAEARTQFGKVEKVLTTQRAGGKGKERAVPVEEESDEEL